MRITLEDVGRRFNGRDAVRDLSLEIEPGQVVAVLGANGAGKTTLLRLLAGWLPLSDGTIRFDESPLRPTATRLRRRVMLLDDGTLRREAYPVRIIGQQIQDYAADRPGIENEIADWFDALDITRVYHSPLREMSKGECYKVAMVGLFVVQPQVWLLDEPFSAGLDANGLQMLEAQLRAHAGSGGIVIFSSQWPDHARRLSDRALVLHTGRLVWDAEPTAAVPETQQQSADGPLRAVLQGLGRENE